MSPPPLPSPPCTAHHEQQLDHSGGGGNSRSKTMQCNAMGYIATAKNPSISKRAVATMELEAISLYHESTDADNAGPDAGEAAPPGTLGM